MSSDNILLRTADSILRKSTLLQITYDWEIRNFSTLTNIFDFKLDSPSFIFCGEEWYLRIYPCGVLNMGEVSLFLRKQATPSVSTAPYTSRPVSFTLGIKKANGSVHKSSNMHRNVAFNKREHSFGIQEFIKKSDLLNSKGVVSPKGVLTVFCTVELKDVDDSNGGGTAVKEEPSQNLSTCGLEMLARNFKELYFSGSEGDIKIKVKEKEFTSHKAVLAARCPVFRSMLELDMAEKNSGSINIVDCDPDCFNDFLLFLYSGELNVVSFQNAMGLYYIADKYDVTQLKDACSACMNQDISVENFCDIVHFATLHNEPELLNTATKFFIGNANKIVTTPEWMSFLTENPIIANELLIKMTSKYIT